ncbi:hypothetical protein [Streptomyces sp. SP18CS02]|uniref:hypothetical protein n=1 Tax=Streptomyces sp. SP18CS02 TaxID=3002531 RepID=UPI002E75C947|nr:hypothetical protein [Streptomyces sp. SP18CS02]MEE1754805.1 hypothetical protein [Streptomyces sp. SP18CS02]
MAEDRAESAGRGATVIADRVVAKIAAQAAREALGDLPEGVRKPRATVVVHRDSARVRITLELGYPADIAGSCGEVRRQVGRQVKALAGMEVPEVAVQVERLHAPFARGDDRGRRVR